VRYLEDKKKEVDLYLEGLFREERRLSGLKEAIRYSLLAGGKRVRPILTIAACEACGWGPEGRELAVPVGAAFEMIHTYSLIHDDLPAMDNDDLRRGRPTNHKVFGEANAILAGDALLTEAFGLIASLKTKRPEKLLRVIDEVARAAGVEGMAGGQAVDLESEGKQLTKDLLEQLHRMKTGCLIRGSVVAGALVADADPRQLEAIRGYGEAIGLAFQIADDLLDVEGKTEDLGKTARSDAAHSKATYPSVVGIESSKRLAQQGVDKAIHSLAPFDHLADPLREIARFIVSRKS